MTAPRYRWQPTTKEIAKRYGLLESDVIRFDHNTSPFPTTWAAPLVMPLASGLNEYPGASYRPLREAAARYHGVEPENVVPGAGIDELILLAARTFLGRSKRGTAITPGYPLYEIATLQTGADFVAVPFDPVGFGFPRRAIGEAAETADVTWLCVPHNPTGARFADADIERVILDAKGVVVIDAAYAEFAGDRWASWIGRHDNLIVCATLSKAFGLAGARVGVALASPDLADALDGHRPPGSISSLSAALAVEALAATSRMERHVERIIRRRDEFAGALRGLGIGVLAGSKANFLLCEVGEQSHELAASLIREGLVIRTFADDSEIGHFIRLTARSREDNERLVVALAERLG